MEIVDKKNQEIVEQRRNRILSFLRSKGVISKTCSNMRISFDDNKSVYLVDLFEEFLNHKDNIPFMDILNKVEQFHTTYDIPIEDKPTVIEPREGAIRLNLLWEEAKETQDATREEDIVEVLDGLGDQFYIVFGTVLKYGMKGVIVEALLAIHDSNMTKLSADGSPIYRKSDGKVMKGPYFEAPTENLKKLLQREHGGE